MARKNNARSITVEGLSETVDALDRLPQVVALGVLAKALDRAGGVIQAAMEAAAPYELLQEARVEVTVDSQGRGGIAKIGYGDNLTSRTEIPASALALWTELGHWLVTHKPSKRRIKRIPPNAFMRRAADASAERAMDVFEDNLLSALEKTWETAA